MTGPVTFVSHDLVVFPSYYTWVDFKHFEIDPSESDETLLLHLLAHGQYHDDYAGQDASEQSHHSLHGPYRLEAIRPGHFEHVTLQQVADDLRGWVDAWVTDEDSATVAARLSTEVLPSVTGDTFLRLPDLRASAEHDWGWVVGTHGFHEVVAVNRATSSLTLLVASDD